MRLAVRFADKVVGVSIVAAGAILVFVLFMLGANQRWFARDFTYYAYFDSAVGLSVNMPVQHRGFSIGQIREVTLTEDDRVRVRFIVFDVYTDRVREGTLVELAVSPIAALGGNQFVLYPGLGEEPIPEGRSIPLVGSPEGRQLVARGLSRPPQREDGIGAIVERLSALLGTLNEALVGTEETTLGRSLLGIQDLVRSLTEAADEIGLAAGGIGRAVDGISDGIAPTLANIKDISDSLADPDGALLSILDGEGEVYGSLVASLASISQTLAHLERTAAFIPGQLPQVAALLTDLQGVLRTAEDVLIALTRNPLLRGGVPDRPGPGPGGTSSRNLEF